MKARIKEKNKDGFKKFNLKLTIESEIEARTLYHLFNASVNEIEIFFREYFKNATTNYNKDIVACFNSAYSVMKSKITEKNINLFKT